MANLSKQLSRKATKDMHTPTVWYKHLTPVHIEGVRVLNDTSSDYSTHVPRLNDDNVHSVLVHVS